MSQIILLLVTGLTPIVNLPPGGKVASLQLAVIATGQAVSVTPQNHLKEEQPLRVNKIDVEFYFFSCRDMFSCFFHSTEGKNM